ncbi:MULTISPECIES: hypothetical protein [unclassified Gluconobacter]|uniref:hypothetical protein n=1 Tax=unclassified Gluconobacter TaxID=2644261 RepID=UPI001C04E550|nr:MULTISPECIES: hypothetical protein [unclassified Gluconobacter]
MSEMIRLSYAELAERLGVSKEAAKSRVRRAGWLRVVDNTGIARFSVPKDIFDTPNRHDADTVADDTPDTPPAPQADMGATLAAIEALREALTRAEAARSEADMRSLDLAEQVGRLKAERDAARAEIEELRRVPEPETPPTPKAAPLAYPPRRRWWPFG